MVDISLSNYIRSLAETESLGASAKTKPFDRDAITANQNDLAVCSRVATVRIKDESPVSHAIPVRKILSTCAGKQTAVFVRDAERSEQTNSHSGEVVLGPRSEFELHRDIAKALAPAFHIDCSGCWATDACTNAKAVEKASGHGAMLVPCGWIAKVSQSSRDSTAIEQYNVVSSKSFFGKISGSVIHHQYSSLSLRDAMKS